MGAKPCCTSSPTGADNAGSDDPTRDDDVAENLIGAQAALAPAVVENTDQKLVAEAAIVAESSKVVHEELAVNGDRDGGEKDVSCRQENEEKVESAEEQQRKEDEEKRMQEEEQHRLKVEQEEQKRKEEAEAEAEAAKKAAAEKKKKAEEKKKKAAEEAEKKKKAAEEEKKKEAELKKLLAEAGVHFSKAAQSGKSKTITMLLEAKANPDEQDGKGRRPLQVAILEGNASIVKLLLDGKANPNLEGTGIQTGPTYPLHVAARDDHNVEIATLLLEAGADANLKNQRNQTAELVAEGKRHTHFVAAVRKFREKQAKK